MTTAAFVTGHADAAGQTYLYEELSLRNRQAFIDAWEHGFARKLPAETCDWIFNAVNRLFVTRFEGRIVAGYGLYPMRAVVFGHEQGVALCNNVFVAPEHQGKFLFSRLGRFALQAVGATSTALAFGIPNPAAVAGHRRIGWHTQAVPFLERTRSAGAKMSASTAPTGPVWRCEKPTDAELAAIESCSRRSAAGREFAILKTMAFSRWRFLGKPAVDYWFALTWRGASLSAYAVAKYFEPKKCLHIIDVDGESAGIDRLIDSIDSIGRPFESIDLWASTVHRQRFEAAGFQVGADTSTLILIEPASMKGVDISAGLQLVLADNDVY